MTAQELNEILWESPAKDLCFYFLNLAEGTTVQALARTLILAEGIVWGPGDPPALPQRRHAAGHRAARCCEVVFLQAVEVPTQTAHAAGETAGHGDGEELVPVVLDIQAEVGLQDDQQALLEELHLAAVQAHRETPPLVVHLRVDETYFT